MKKLLLLGLFTSVLLGNSATPVDGLTIYKGRAVEAVEYALAHSTQADALDSVYLYGTDTRLYVMIRGWLVQELAGAQSLVEAHGTESEKGREFQQKVLFLQRAIGRIDLE